MIVVMTAGGERQIPSADVQTVRTRKQDSVWRVLAGAALGFGGGAGLGAAWFYGGGRYGAKPPGYGREFIIGTGVVDGVLGALIGWRIDAARTRSEVIYKARLVREGAQRARSSIWTESARCAVEQPVAADGGSSRR